MKDRKPLTDRESDCLVAIVTFIEEYKYQPSYRQIAQMIGVQSCVGFLRNLEIKNYIKSTGQARAIEIWPDVYAMVCKEIKRSKKK